MAAWRNVKLDKQTGNGFERTLTIAGQPAFETYQIDRKTAELQILVARRYLLSVGASNITAAQLQKIAEDLPISKLLELKS